MEMSRPIEQAREDSTTTTAPPAFATAPPPTSLKVGSVEDLERKLKMLSSSSSSSTTATTPSDGNGHHVPAVPAVQVQAPAPAQQPVTATASASTVPVKGGKNALLVRRRPVEILYGVLLLLLIWISHCHSRICLIIAVVPCNCASRSLQSSIVDYSLPPRPHISHTLPQARIMAAKEKSQQSKAPAPATKPVMSSNTTVDLLSDFDVPSTMNDPPPSYDTNFLAGVPPPEAAAIAAPPAFDAVENAVMQQINQSLPPPPAIDDMFSFPPPPPPAQDVLMPPSAPPAASAPSFEDLLGGGYTTTTTTTTTQQQQQQHQHEFHPPPVPPPSMEALSSSSSSPSAEPDIDESILNALDPAEREAFIDEQRRIMEQIEKEKVGNKLSGAAARAAAFDQRSTAAVAQVAASYDSSTSGRNRHSRPATAGRSNVPTISSLGTVNLGEGTEVPLHGQEKTQQAIKDGTALIVQCLSCNNWMQVTGEAEVMMCPLCNTITRVERAGAATTADMEAAAQLAADAELAEKLQKEEYARAQGGGSSSSRSRSSRPTGSSSSPSQRPAQSSGAGEQSWYDWFMGVPAPAPATSAAISSGARSAEIRPQTGLISAQTGEERRGGRPQSSYTGSGGGGGARVAEQKSMFACVADAVGTAATQALYSLPQDEEGNYHGVDGSSLLAMPEDISRQRE